MFIAQLEMRRALIIATAALVATVCTSARAAFIDNGGLQFPAATVPAPAGGTVVADTRAVPVVAQTFSGTVQSQVISGDTNNPLGGETFVYRITNGSGSLNSIERATIDSFAGFTTDVGYVSGTGDAAPADASRGSSGDIIGFDFKPFPGTVGTAIAPGQTTDFLVIRTNSPSFEASTLSLIDGSTGTAPSFAPAAVVPEPAGVGLLLCAAGGLLARRRRSR
jgi:hypothetical protein